MRWAIATCFALQSVTVPAFAAGPVVTRLLSTRTTIAGQPIVLPQGDIQVVVSRLVIPPGGSVRVHKHLSQRYAYVLSGELKITLETGPVLHYKAGDFIVAARNTWHYSTAVGGAPAVLLIIDQVEAGHTNTVWKQDAQ